LIATLSAGPVGPADKIGHLNKSKHHFCSKGKY